MEKFWAFINRREVRLALAAICFSFMIQGIFRVWAGQTNMELFRGGGEILLWGGWALANTLHAFGKQARRLNIAINTGLAMVLVGIFMQMK